MVGYPRHFLAVLWVVIVALTITGLVLIPGAFELRWDMDVPVRLPGGSRILVAFLHALFAFVVLTLMGSLYAMHMRMGWRRWENVRTGIATVGTFVALTLTGLGIYYLADEQFSRWVSASHIAVGGLGAVAVAAHAIIGVRLRRERLARRHATVPDSTSEASGKAGSSESATPPRTRERLRAVR